MCHAPSLGFHSRRASGLQQQRNDSKQKGLCTDVKDCALQAARLAVQSLHVNAVHEQMCVHRCCLSVAGGLNAMLLLTGLS